MVNTEKKIVLYLRSKGGLSHGWGHVIRSLTLANYLKNTLKPVQLLLGVEGDRGIEEFIQKQKIQYVFFSDVGEITREKKILKTFSPNIIIVDMITVPDALLLLYRQHCQKLVLFNDLALDYKTGDIIITPQLLSHYPERQNKQIMLNGPEYFILLPDICKVRARQENRNQVPVAKKLLIIMGGCIHHRIFEKIAKTIELLEDLHLSITFVLGYDHDVSPEACHALKSRGVTLYSGTEKLGKIMAGADIALASAGYVKCELASLGIPMLLVSVVAHQQILAIEFVQHTECAEYLGDIHSLDSKTIARSIRSLVLDYKKRKRMAQAGKRLIDGLALERITRVILSSCF